MVGIIRPRKQIYRQHAPVMIGIRDLGQFIPVPGGPTSVNLHARVTAQAKAATLMSFPGSGNVSINGLGFHVVSAVSPSGQGSGFSGAGSRQIYVSSSTGSDSSPNTGTQAAPFASITKGASYMRAGSPDQLLLKCGDSWTNDDIGQSANSYKNFYGSSTNAIALIGSYGTGARPKLNVPCNQTDGSALYFYGSNNFGGSNLAIIGIELYAYQKDPASGSYLGASSSVLQADGTDGILLGLSTTLTATLNIIEDCKFSFFATNIAVQAYDSSSLVPNSTLIIRRNISTNAYCISGHSQGLHIEGMTLSTVQENVFDTNGWSPNAGLQAVGAGPTEFNRNFYFSQTPDGITTGLLQMLGNISTNSSSEGFQARTGGVINDNLVAFSTNGFDVGHQQNDSGLITTIANGTRNVILNSIIQSTVPEESGGIDVLYSHGTSGSVSIINSIIANVGSSYVDACATTLDPNCTGCSMSGLIIFKWPFSISGINGTGLTTPTYSDGSGNSISSVYDQSGGNTEGYTHPTPTASGSVSLIGDYYNSIGGVIGSYASLDAAFIAAAAARAGGTWNTQLSAYAVNNYVQTGFDVSYTKSTDPY